MLKSEMYKRKNERVDKLEEKYLIDVLSNQFETSKNNIYCSKLESEFNRFLNSKFSINRKWHSNHAYSTCCIRCKAR